MELLVQCRCHFSFTSSVCCFLILLLLQTYVILQFLTGVVGVQLGVEVCLLHALRLVTAEDGWRKRWWLQLRNEPLIQLPVQVFVFEWNIWIIAIFR
jgi:hypothetical protein